MITTTERRRASAQLDRPHPGDTTAGRGWGRTLGAAALILWGLRRGSFLGWAAVLGGAWLVSRGGGTEAFSERARRLLPEQFSPGSVFGRSVGGSAGGPIRAAAPDTGRSALDTEGGMHPGYSTDQA